MAGTGEQVASGQWVLLRLGLLVALVCVLAYAGLRLAARKYGGGSNGGLTLVERVMVGPRRSLLLVRVGEKLILVGSSEAGLHTLAELDAEDVATAVEQAPVERDFSTVLSKVGRTTSRMFHVKQGEES
jgi:flagellar protein FliO/FliZ